MPADRPWTDADRELVGEAWWSVDESSADPTQADAVLDALTAAGWRKVTGILMFDDTVTAEQAEQFRVAWKRAVGPGWAYRLHVRRLPWWRRLLKGGGGG